MLTTFTSFRLISSDLGKSIARTSSQPVVAREIDYYNKTIGSIKSIEAFVKNDRVFKFAMKSFGLEDMDYAKAFMKKLDTSNNPASHAGQGCERAGGRIGPPIRGGIIGFARPAGAPASPYRHAAAYFARSQTRRRML